MDTHKEKQLVINKQIAEVEGKIVIDTIITIVLGIIVIAVALVSLFAKTGYTFPMIISVIFGYFANNLVTLDSLKTKLNLDLKNY